MHIKHPPIHSWFTEVIRQDFTNATNQTAKYTYKARSLEERHCSLFKNRSQSNVDHEEFKRAVRTT